MRKIIGNIKSVFNIDYKNKIIVFILCNKYNQPIIKPINNFIPLKIETQTDENSEFSIELYETNDIKIPMHYTMQLQDTNIAPIKLYISQGTKDIQFQNLTTPQADLSSFYYLNPNGKYIFDSETILLIDKFFVHQNCFTTGKEDELFCEFIKYANGKVNSKEMKALDELLGNIIDILSPQYQAVEQVVSDNIHKAKDLITALGSLDDMNKQTQQMMIDNQQAMQDAIKKATMQSMIFS